MDEGTAAIAISPILVLIQLCFLVIGIICVVLFIKLARRGIKTLDDYIEKNKF